MGGEAAEVTGREIPIANIYYLLCYAWRHVQERDVVRVGEIEGLRRVHDLLARVLANGTFRLIRRGIDRGYVERREDLAGIRGKLAVGETAKRALRARGRAACDFEEMSADVLHNRILRSTLASLLKLPGLDRGVGEEVRLAYRKLRGVRVVPLTRRLFQQVQLDRNRRIYHFLLSICRLVYDQLLVNERTGEARFVGFDDERMAKLFEDFVIEFYRQEQRTYQVNRSGRQIKWDCEGTREDQRKMIPRMEADMILESPTRRIILDAKFYREALGGRFGGRLRSGHLYQLLAYLRNRELTIPTGPRHTGILLYPEVDEPVAIDVVLEGFEIRARSVDLTQEWESMHTAMVNVLS